MWLEKMTCFKDFNNQLQTFKNRVLKQNVDRNSCSEGQQQRVSFQNEISLFSLYFCRYIQNTRRKSESQCGVCRRNLLYLILQFLLFVLKHRRCWVGDTDTRAVWYSLNTIIRITYRCLRKYCKSVLQINKSGVTVFFSLNSNLQLFSGDTQSCLVTAPDFSPHYLLLTILILNIL